MVQKLIELVEAAGYKVLWLDGRYQVQVGPGCVRAIIHTPDRKMFWTLDFPVSLIESGNYNAIGALIDRRAVRDKTDGQF